MDVNYYKLDPDTKEVLPLNEDLEKVDWNNNQLFREFVNGYCVSTVFLPIDHFGNFFECYVFEGNEEEGITNWCERYGQRASTYAHIKHIHEETVKGIREGILP